MQLVSDGYRDWQHLSKRLREHENSHCHIESILKWSNLQAMLNSGSGIDKQTELILKNEKNHWEQVFKRLVEIIKFLSEHNLAFRGSVDKLYQPHNGNFLGLVELLAKFDSIMMEHLNRIYNGDCITTTSGKIYKTN